MTMRTDIFVVAVPALSFLGNQGFALRREVFVHEQGVPEANEIDAFDSGAEHFVAIVAGEIVGTLRLIFDDQHVKIGRVAVRATSRGKGIANAMMVHAMQHARSKGHSKFYLASQIDKMSLYGRLGFSPFGAEFLDGGIRHRAMKNY